MNAAITVTAPSRFDLQPATGNKNTESHLRAYNQWCKQAGQDILRPDLAAYRDHLQSRLSSTSVRVHLSHIRQAYRRLAQNRDVFYNLIPREFAGTISDQKAYVDEWLKRLDHAIDPDNSTVRIITEQDAEDDKHLRLTKDQASDFLNSFGTDTIKGLRNTAIVGFMLCTGIREFELAALEVDDLRQQLGGQLALRVKAGKGAKKRLVPYGSLSWVLAIVDKYCKLAGITQGRVFSLSVRQIENIVISKPVNVDGQLRMVRAHDLRRTYTRLLYLEGMNLVAIKDNLGHNSTRTTERYIGILDAANRQPANLYRFDLARL